VQTGGRSGVSGPLVMLPQEQGCLRASGEKASPDSHPGRCDVVAAVVLPSARRRFHPQSNLIVRLGQHGSSPARSPPKSVSLRGHIRIATHSGDDAEEAAPVRSGSPHFAPLWAETVCSRA
jgi:hypothetical protein